MHEQANEAPVVCQCQTNRTQRGPRWIRSTAQNSRPVVMRRRVTEFQTFRRYVVSASSSLKLQDSRL
jgi:hypothetical protein